VGEKKEEREGVRFHALPAAEMHRRDRISRRKRHWRLCSWVAMLSGFCSWCASVSTGPGAYCRGGAAVEEGAALAGPACWLRSGRHGVGQGQDVQGLGSAAALQVAHTAGGRADAGSAGGKAGQARRARERKKGDAPGGGAATGDVMQRSGRLGPASWAATGAPVGGREVTAKKKVTDL
jgi:hypothetical protein